MFIRIKRSTLLLAIATLITAAQVIIVLSSYDRLPPVVPMFVDFAGNPTRVMDKNIVSVLRFPAMSILLLATCWVMSASASHSQGEHMPWPEIALLNSIKMASASLEMSYEQAAPLIRIVTHVAALVGIALIAIGLIKIYRNHKRDANIMIPKLSKAQSVTVSLLLALYAFVAIFPLLL